MDIPAPSKDSEGQKIEVSTTSSSSKMPAPESTAAAAKSETTTASGQAPAKTDLKDEALSREEAERKKVAEMIASKKYFLPIKEKRTNPALTFTLLPKKSKKKSATKKTESTKKPKAKNKQTLLLGILALVLVGALVAIDAGVIDVGIKLPFDLIKNG
jgi:cobalamin biosynthesis Mg chelatase CobN